MLPIEAATAADCHAIAEVHVGSWRQAYAHILPADYLAALSVDQREARWRNSLQQGLPQLLVARSESGIAGFVAFGPSRDQDAGPQCAEVWALYLAPGFWSQGAGRHLWLAARERLASQGFTTVTLWVIAGNERAIRFYQAAGFRIEDGPGKEFMLGGTLLREHRCIFDLKAS